MIDLVSLNRAARPWTQDAIDRSIIVPLLCQGSLHLRGHVAGRSVAVPEDRAVVNIVAVIGIIPVGLFVCVLTRRLLVCVPPFFGAGVAFVVVCAFFFFFFCLSSVCAACTDAKPTNKTVANVIIRFIKSFLLLLRHSVSSIYSPPLLPHCFEQNNRHRRRQIQAPRSVHRDGDTILPILL